MIGALRPRAGRRRAVVVGCLVLVIAFLRPAPAGAQADPPIPTPQVVNVELVGRSDLGNRAQYASVWGHRSFAYVGSTFTPAVPASCRGRGVTIVDVANPATPTPVGALAERPGTTAEDVQVLTVFTRAFTGDLLATGLSRCGPDGVGGLSLWDVTDPRQPAELGFVDTGAGPAGIHEVRLFRRGTQTIAVVTVPGSEALDPARQGDVRIVDVTDPRAPTQLADWGIRRTLGLDPRPTQGQGQDAEMTAQGVTVSPDGLRAFVSYWDGGVVILDLTDLRNPRFLGRTRYTADADGNASSVTVTRGDRLLVVANDDPAITASGIVATTAAGETFLRAAYSGTSRLSSAATAIKAPAVLEGRACPERFNPETGATEPADPLPVDPDGRVVAVEAGGCPSLDKVLRVQGRGATAVLILDGDGALAPGAGDARQVTIPVAVIGQEGAEQLRTILGSGDTSISLAPTPPTQDDWGGLQLWDTANPGRPILLATFKTDDAQVSPTAASGSGVYAAHQVAALGDRLYAAWYADGLRVLDISDPTQPREVGAFVPSGVLDASTGEIQPPAVWGVYPRGDIVLISDQRSGLYLLRDRPADLRPPPAIPTATPTTSPTVTPPAQIPAGAPSATPTATSVAPSTLPTAGTPTSTTTPTSTATPASTVTSTVTSTPAATPSATPAPTGPSPATSTTTPTTTPASR
ncbi:MAG: hypothetical protein IT305_16310 [Chloroflexi bacterium]|nr:hypothetical protein [Chloroflexota bacterium]